jgi:hypothetical protein
MATSHTFDHERRCWRLPGIQSVNEAAKAMEIIASHCGGDYAINNRSEENGWTTVDASCN